MTYPLRENLEVYGDAGEERIRCARCSHAVGRPHEDWRKHCQRRTFPPTKAGPLMSILVGHYVLEKLYCPGCRALLDSDMVEAGAGGR